jgi:hypothetical protein
MDLWINRLLERQAADTVGKQLCRESLNAFERLQLVNELLKFHAADALLPMRNVEFYEVFANSICHV